MLKTINYTKVDPVI